MSKKKKIILSSVSVGIVLLGVILTIILVNIRRFSLRPSDYLNFNDHTTMNVIELDSSLTPNSGTPYSNGTVYIKSNTTNKLGIFSYSQNKTIVNPEYDDIDVLNSGSQNGKTYFRLHDNSKTSDINLVDEYGQELSIISAQNGTKNRAYIMTKDVSISTNKNKVKAKIGNKYTETPVDVKEISFERDYTYSRGYSSDELKDYETWKITTLDGITYTNLYKIEDGKHRLIQTLDNELGNSLESKNLQLDFLNDGTPILINIRPVNFESQTQAVTYEIYDINFNLKGSAQLDVKLLSTDIQFRLGNSLFFQKVMEARDDRYDFSETNSITGITSYYTIQTYKLNLKNGSFDQIDFDYLINKVGAEFNVDTSLLSVTQIKNKKLDTSSIILANERLQTKKIDYYFDTILKVNDDRYITSIDGTSNYNLIDRSYNLIAHLEDFENIFATRDSIIVQNNSVTYICNTDGVVIKKISNGNFVYLQDDNYYINKITKSVETITTEEYYRERLGLAEETPFITRNSSTHKGTFLVTEYESISLETINDNSGETVATIVVCVSKQSTYLYKYDIFDIDGNLLGTITDVSDTGYRPNYYYSNDNSVVLTLGTKKFVLDR